MLMVASSYPRFEGDTASIFLKNLAHHLANNGVRVHVLAPSDCRVRESAADEGVSVHYFRYFPTCPHMLAYGSGILPNLQAHPWVLLQVPFFLLALLFSLLRESARVKPSIIHAHWIIPVGLISTIAGKILKIPVIVTAHGGDAFGLKRGIFPLLKKFTLKHSKAWTANTVATALTAGGFRETPDEEPTIIPMGVDCDRFASGDGRSVPDFSVSGGCPIVLFVGRLVEKKGVRYLVEAVADLVVNRNSKLRLWIVGDGDQRQGLQRLVVELGIADFVEFKGMVSNERLPDYYAAGDVFVAPSVVDQHGDTEGQGVVIIEAMSAGLPVIASRVGGVEDVITDGENGLLVEPEDASALADAIEKCLSDPESKAMSSRAYSMVVDKYDWSVVAQKFIKLYTSVSNRSSLDGGT